MPYSERAHYAPVASLLSSLSSLRSGLGNFAIPLLPAMKVPMVDLRGKQAIVTGANSGIGFEAAKSLAKMGARVILACRNKDKAEQARRDIMGELGEEAQVGQVEVEILDCASLGSVRQFIERWGKRDATRVDILINNAGERDAFFSLGPLQLTLHICCSLVQKGCNPNTLVTTPDGFECNYQSNHLAHVLLTLSLLNHSYLAPDARIVNVSSIVAFSSPPLDEHNANSSDLTRGCKEGELLPWDTMVELYSRSKCSQAVWSMTLQRKLQGTAEWKNVIVQACHPGVVKSPMLSRPGGLGGADGFGANMFKRFANIFGISNEQGAVVPVWLAVAQKPAQPKLRGLFWDRMRWMWVSPWNMETQRQDRLWDKWCSEAGVSFQ